MSDYATTKQAMIDNCTDADVKVEIEKNFTEELYNDMCDKSAKAKEHHG